MIETLVQAGYAGVVSVECDTWDQAARSRVFLESALTAAAAQLEQTVRL
ncbi:MAG: hypothetical protein M5U12_16755 [Verrucomicrobia bacterium]|nr:hypothetical protein [Verrucomicrobiota bacterium]